jgi:hypothetical protein
MNGYDKLKSVIQQANPEIMELKFGCETNEGIVFTPQRGIKVEIYIEGDGRIEEYHVSDLKILGRPIRLADVLLALDKLRVDGIDNIQVDTNGDICSSEHIKYLNGKEIQPELHNPEYWCNWNLKDDNLENQREETKQFLIKLLV